MSRSRLCALLLGGLLALAPTAAVAVDPGTDSAADARRGSGPFTPGAPGVGDPYYPLDGNGGYDVRHYDLDVRYDPATDALTGKATITAHATQDLSAFNLDLSGLTVRSIVVDGRDAVWSRDGDELTVTPPRGLRERSRFRVVVRYDGVPTPIVETLGLSGFMHTDDGAFVAGQPHVAATWFPVNDHPIDTASYTVEVSVPEGLEAVSNGVLRTSRTRAGWTTWRWDARDPMASYLVTLAIGEFDISAYRADGVRYWDAVDPDLDGAGPRTGAQAAITGTASAAYQRLARTLTVPAAGATLSFWVDRDTEPVFDVMMVEARVAGSDAWTTLPDLNGHTTQDTDVACPGWLEMHPFLAHYQAADRGGCIPSGTTGQWWAASGASVGFEEWVVDLAPYAGRQVEVSLSHVTDGTVEGPGLVVDDVVVSTGEGSTSFEDDGDALDGWFAAAPPAGSTPDAPTWFVGTADDAPPGLGENVRTVLARQPEVTAFLSELFGRYPFRASGAIVDDLEDFGFALETQTRSVYPSGIFTDPTFGAVIVVHELAHQWLGDKLTLARWQDIWLNEGFASYAEWLWLEREGLLTAQEGFDLRASTPADSGFWDLPIGDPGPDNLFDGAVYERGAMTLHALRTQVGDDAFFTILRDWASQRPGHVTTPDFVALVEEVSGQDLDAFFEVWLHSGVKPDGLLR